MRRSLVATAGLVSMIEIMSEPMGGMRRISSIRATAVPATAAGRAAGTPTRAASTSTAPAMAAVEP